MDASAGQSLQLEHLLCIYENQPLSASSTHAVPRLLAQLLNQLAHANPKLKLTAVSPPGGSITGVENVSAELDGIEKLRTRAFNNRIARTISKPRIETGSAFRKTCKALEGLSKDSDSTVVLTATMTGVIAAKQVFPSARVIYWVQGMPRLGQEALASRAVNLADAVVAPSQALYRDLFDLICRDRFAPPVWVIPNTIDRIQFKPEPPDVIAVTRHRLGIKDDQFAVMHIGRAPEKGLQVVEAALRIMPFDRSILLISAGGLKKEHRRLGEQTEVLELGRVTPSELNQIYQACDIGVVPSVWWENCPLALIEMMSLGLCPIGSRVGGIPEMIEHMTSGLIVESPNDAQAWAQAISQLANRDDLRIQLGREAQRRVENQFNQTQTLAKWLQVFHNVTASAQNS